MANVKGGWRTAIGYAVYCGNETKPNRLSLVDSSYGSYFSPKATSAKMVEQVDNSLKASGYQKVVTFFSEMPAGAAHFAAAMAAN